MFKKLSGVVAALAISVTSFIALPAHATTPSAPIINTNGGIVSIEVDNNQLGGEDWIFAKVTSVPAGISCEPERRQWFCEITSGYTPGTKYKFQFETKTIVSENPEVLSAWSNPSALSREITMPNWLPTISDLPSIVGFAGVALDPQAALTPTNFVGTPTYTISPALPDGLTINSSTGVISGTPLVVSAEKNYTITATGIINNGLAQVPGSAKTVGTLEVQETLGFVPTPVVNGTTSTIYANSINAGGSTFKLTGKYLAGVSEVKIGGTLATKVLNRDGSLTVTIPAGTTGLATVVLGYSSLEVASTVTAGKINYVGATKVAQTLTLSTGDDNFNLSEGARAYSASSTFADTNPTSLTVSVVAAPASACALANGKILFFTNAKCTITATQAGDAGILAATPVVKTIHPNAVVTSIDQLYALDAGKNKMTIKGSGLTSVTKVYLGTTEVIAPNLKPSADGSSLVVTIPAATGTANAGQSVDLKYDYSGHVGSVDTNHNFTYVGTTKWSQVVTAPTVSLPTTFTTTPTVLDGAATRDAAALDVSLTYKSLTPKVCSIVNGSLVYLTAGTCTFSTSQTGGPALVASKATANTSVVIAKANQTLTVASPTLDITTQTPANVAATLSSAAAGVLVAYASSDETTCTVDGAGEVTGYKAGNCIITLTQAGDARFNAVATPVTVAVTVTVDATPNPTVADTVTLSEKQNIANRGAASFGYNNSGLLFAWDKARGTLKAKAFDTMIGYIHAKITFTVDSVDYSCDVVFGNAKAMPVNTPAKKTAARAVKVAEAKSAFCADANTITLPVGGILTSNFAKVKSAAKTKDQKTAQVIAAGKLKGYTGDITIEVTKYRAWPSTLADLRGDLKQGSIISATHTITTATLQ
ncbi:MAG: putative Ig domain-containing protein [Micrococcales bacterium]